jgi:curved DNA-binding protein CbpA
MTLYEELELPTFCTFDEIKHQYRILAGVHHPDKGGDEEKFKRIKFAYEVLSDPIRRKQYDETKTTNEPNDIHKEAISELACLFFSIIPTFDCANGNLIETMKAEVIRIKLRLDGEEQLNEKYISNIEIVKQKLKLKNPNEENVIMSFVDTQLESRYQDRKVIKHKIEIMNHMTPILEKYEYGFMELFNDAPIMEIEAKTE